MINKPQYKQEDDNGDDDADADVVLMTCTVKSKIEWAYICIETYHIVS